MGTFLMYNSNFSLRNGEEYRLMKQLVVPYVSQLGQGANYGEGDSGTACVTALIRALTGQSISVDDVGKAAGLPAGYTATHIINTLIPMAKNYGINLKYHSGITAAKIRDELDNNRTVLLLLHYSQLPKRRRLTFQGAHCITVHGYNKDYFFYDDPDWSSGSDGENIPIAVNDLMSAVNSTGAHFATAGMALLLVDRRLPDATFHYEVDQEGRLIRVPVNVKQEQHGFDLPVADFSSPRVWPGAWYDANPYGSRYHVRPNREAYLNLPGDLNRDKDVFSIGDGVVTAAYFSEAWGNLIVIRHDPPNRAGQTVYSRYGHVNAMAVKEGDTVTRNEYIARVGAGNPNNPFAYHLHFDISLTSVLATSPGDWPGLDRNRLLRDYVDPLIFLRQHRPL
jgi:murein DD-endopeptidase MepM/ murein hydrolase activator NlpD